MRNNSTAPGVVELTSTERADVRESLNQIREAALNVLPKNYAVQVITHSTPSAQQYGVAVKPPNGAHVKANLDIRSFNDSGDGLREYQMSDEDCVNVARDMAASAVVQFSESDQAINADWPAS